jgi:hypothetical protein
MDAFKARRNSSFVWHRGRNGIATPRNPAKMGGFWGSEIINPKIPQRHVTSWLLVTFFCEGKEAKEPMVAVGIEPHTSTYFLAYGTPYCGWSLRLPQQIRARLEADVFKQVNSPKMLHALESRVGGRLFSHHRAPHLCRHFETYSWVHIIRRGKYLLFISATRVVRRKSWCCRTQTNHNLQLRSLNLHSYVRRLNSAWPQHTPIIQDLKFLFPTVMFLDCFHASCPRRPS